MLNLQAFITIFSFLGIVALAIIVIYFIYHKIDNLKYGSKYSIKSFAEDIACELPNVFTFILIILLIACTVFSSIRLNNAVRDMKIVESNKRYSAFRNTDTDLNTNPFFLPHGTYCYYVDLDTDEDPDGEDYYSDIPAQIKIDYNGIKVEKVFLPEGEILIDTTPESIEETYDKAIDYLGGDVGWAVFIDQNEIGWYVTLSSQHASHPAVEETVVYYQIDTRDTERNQPSIVYSTIALTSSAISLIIICSCKVFYKKQYEENNTTINTYII